MRLATEISKNITESIVDGDGYRIVMFTQGCIHKCKGCHNPTTWDINAGFEYSVLEIANHILNIYKKGKGFFSGITISGGEPLIQKKELLELLSILKNEEPNLNIWIYTGFESVDVQTKFTDISQYVDVFVTGKYIEELNTSKFKEFSKSDKYRFRGSINQELLQIKK